MKPTRARKTPAWPIAVANLVRAIDGVVLSWVAAGGGADSVDDAATVLRVIERILVRAPHVSGNDADLLRHLRSVAEGGRVGSARAARVRRFLTLVARDAERARDGRDLENARLRARNLAMALEVNFGSAFAGEDVDALALAMQGLKSSGRGSVPSLAGDLLTRAMDRGGDLFLEIEGATDPKKHRSKISKYLSNEWAAMKAKSSVPD